MIIDIPIPLYGIIIVLSLLIGIIYILYNLNNEKIDNKNILLFFMMFLIFSFVFGKLFTVIVSNESLNFFKAGLSSYGGLIGAIIASYIFERIMPFDGKIIKYTTLSLPLIYGLTKIACFVTGCCYGIPYNYFGYVIYPKGLNIPLFPIQIVETFVFLIIFFICNRFKNNKNIIYITLILVSSMKFLLDFLRYEHLETIISPNQIFSIFLFLITIIIYIVNKKVNKM